MEAGIKIPHLNIKNTVETKGTISVLSCIRSIEIENSKLKFKSNRMVVELFEISYFPTKLVHVFVLSILLNWL